MHFQFIGTVRGLLLHTANELELSCGGPHNLRLLLRHATEEETHRGHSDDTIFSVAQSQWDVSPRNRVSFDSLALRRLPEGWQRVPGWELQVDENGRFQRVDIVWMELLPQPFQEFARQVHQELIDAVARAVGLLRWRRNQAGPHSPLSHVSFEWSDDGSSWTHMPASFSSIMESKTGIRTDKGLADEILRLMNEEHDEPIGQKLFREAWENRISDRRSSLLMGIAAAEVGLKHFATELVPATQWILENLPSPPLVSMLRDYLPRLPGKNTIGGKMLAPPTEEIIKVLTDGIGLRNKLTHTAAEEPKYETLEKVLLAVRDVLWLLDYYRGRGWALDYVRPEVRHKIEAAAAN